jgi:hypothetical protein
VEWISVVQERPPLSGFVWFRREAAVEWIIVIQETIHCGMD